MIADTRANAQADAATTTTSAVPAGAMPLFSSGSYRCLEMDVRDVDRLQRFFDANPEYHVAVNGEPPRSDEARQEFDSSLPAGWPFAKRWLLQFADADDSMVAMADAIQDLFAAGVWHLGLFVVATPLHGGGAAYRLYDDLETWMRRRGARWVRLGVVEGNVRAERFWEKAGYLEVRKRVGVAMGQRVNTLRVMVKSLAGGELADYLAMVTRDRPETP